MSTHYCARCKAPHAKYEFPKRGRGSIYYGRKGFVRVCRHKQISWSQIEALIAQVRYDGSDFVHFKEHCKHPSHRRCPGSIPTQFRFQWYVGGTVQRMVRRENVPIYLHLWWESHSRVNQLNLDGQGRLRAPFLRSLFRRTAMVRQPPLGAESDMGMSCFSHPQCRCVYYEIGNALGVSEAPTFENSVPDDTDDTSYIACLRKRPGIHQASSNRVNLERMSARLCAKPPCVPRDDCIVTQYYRRIMLFELVSGIRADPKHLNPTHEWLHALNTENLRYASPACNDPYCRNYFRSYQVHRCPQGYWALASTRACFVDVDELEAVLLMDLS